MGLSHTSSTPSGANRVSFPRHLAAFVEHLKQEGLSGSRIRCLRASARHFLVWLDQECIDVGVIDDAVLRRLRRHDCRCRGMERKRHKMLTGRSLEFISGALRLVRFFEDTQRIRHPGELDEGLRLLEEFLVQCAKQGYAPDTLAGYRSACRHMLVWLHRSRVSMRQINAETLVGFARHDCVCPAPLRCLSKRPKYIYPVKAFSRFLATKGVLPSVAATTNHTADGVLGAFAEWLRRHRGIGETTVVDYLRRVSQMRGQLGDDPGRYNAALVRRVLLRRFATASRSHARTLARISHQRSIALKFLSPTDSYLFRMV